MKQTFIQIDAEQIANWNKFASNAYWQLGCYKKKSAILLNAVTHWAVSKLDVKIRYQRAYRYSANTFDPSDKIGGGLVVKTDPDITINHLGEVGVHFNNTYRLNSFCRKASCQRERLSTIKEKFAYALKNMWKSTSIDNVMTVKIDPTVNDSETVTISFEEYRALYEHLKERDKAKTIKAYGQKAYDDMVGEPLQDQFLISAIETIDEDKHRVEKEYSDKLLELDEKKNKEIKEISAKYAVIKESLIEEKKTKIDELNAQKGMLMQNAI